MGILPLKVHGKLLLCHATAVGRRLYWEGLEGDTRQYMQRSCVELRVDDRCLSLLGPSCLLPLWTGGKGLHAPLCADSMWLIIFDRHCFQSNDHSDAASCS